MPARNDPEDYGNLAILLDPRDAVLGSDPDIAYIPNGAASPGWSVDGGENASAAGRPHLAADYYGPGLDAVNHVGGIQGLILSTNAEGATNGPDTDVFATVATYPVSIVALIEPTTIADAIIIGCGSSSASFFDAWFSGLAVTAEGSIRAAARSAGSGISAEGSAGVVTANTPYVVSCVIASSDVRLRVDSVEVGSASSGSVNPGDDEYDRDKTGGSDGSASGGHANPFTGYMGPVLVYDGALSNEALRGAELWVGWEYLNRSPMQVGSGLGYGS